MVLKSHGEPITVVSVLLFLHNHRRLISTVWHMAGLDPPRVCPAVCTGVPEVMLERLFLSSWLPLSHVGACTPTAAFQAL